MDRFARMMIGRGYWAPAGDGSGGGDGGQGGSGDGGGQGGGSGDGGQGDGGDKQVDPEAHAQLQKDLEATREELEKFRTKHKEAEKHRQQQEAEARKAAEEAAKKAGDLEALEKSWQEKLDQAVGEKTTEVEQLQGMVQQLTVGATAQRLAGEMAVEGSADVLMPHIESRLTMELRDGKPTVKVLRDGKPSALTLDDLKDELTKNPAFAPIIRGSNASGSGPAGKGDGKGAGTNQITRSAFDQLDPVNKAKFMKDGGMVVDD